MVAELSGIAIQDDANLVNPGKSRLGDCIFRLRHAGDMLT